MRIEEYGDARGFIDACYEWLQSREDFYDGLISTSDMISNGSEVFASPYWFGSAMLEEEVVGCGIYAEPDGLLLSEMPLEAIDPLAYRLKNAIGKPKRIVATPNVCHEMAAWWSEHESAEVHAENVWNVYRLDSVKPPAGIARGKLRLAQEFDITTITKLGRDYSAEKPAPINIVDFLIRKVREQSLFIWDYQGARAIAAVSCRSRNGIRISAVFTPKQHRGRGYASAIVASLSYRLLRDDLKFITLAAIAGDRSEKIYRQLGFVAIGTRESLVLADITDSPTVEISF